MNRIRELFQELVIDYVESDMITLTVDKLNLRRVLKTLKETKDLAFNQLIDLCAVDLISYSLIFALIMSLISVGLIVIYIPYKLDY